jgi:hypothetical protein
MHGMSHRYLSIRGWVWEGTALPAKSTTLVFKAAKTVHVVEVMADMMSVQTCFDQDKTSVFRNFCQWKTLVYDG